VGAGRFRLGQLPRTGSTVSRSRTWAGSSRRCQSTCATAACRSSPPVPVAAPRISSHVPTASCASRDRGGPGPIQVCSGSADSVRIDHLAGRDHEAEAALRTILAAVGGQGVELSVGLPDGLHAEHSLGILVGLGLDGDPQSGPDPDGVRAALARRFIRRGAEERTVRSGRR
jgi:hypothetical protein